MSGIQVMQVGNADALPYIIQECIYMAMMLERFKPGEDGTIPGLSNDIGAQKRLLKHVASISGLIHALLPDNTLGQAFHKYHVRAKEMMAGGMEVKEVVRLLADEQTKHDGEVVSFLTHNMLRAMLGRQPKETETPDTTEGED